MGYLFNLLLHASNSVKEWHLALPHDDFAGGGKTEASTRHELSLGFGLRIRPQNRPKKAFKHNTVVLQKCSLHSAEGSHEDFSSQLFGKVPGHTIYPLVLLQSCRRCKNCIASYYLSMCQVQCLARNEVFKSRGTCGGGQDSYTMSAGCIGGIESSSRNLVRSLSDGTLPVRSLRNSGFFGFEAQQSTQKNSKGRSSRPAS